MAMLSKLQVVPMIDVVCQDGFRMRGCDMVRVLPLYAQWK
ncbi:hypothetical protein FB566_0832 [Stackebrandtia endophytica]|uniref:Uncharacterized protein n=1 Tax=Stackebrandtia endophytica TaxID=1496996 RepID=A0A543AS58_9ACTN|nr:hypothetical protein FB566_0832 [Stackebrandtia endophytica]